MRFKEIHERCWTGYRQAGMKKKGDRQVPNCVPVKEVRTGPEMTLNDLLYTAAAKAIHQAGLEGVPMDYEEAIKKAAKIYKIPYTPSELPKLLAQRAEIDRKLAMLKQGKQVAKARRKEKLAPTPAGAEEWFKTHSPTVDRIKPPARTLEETEAELAEDLKKWFKEKWVRFGPDGKIRGDCARGSSKEGKPKCLPAAKAHALGKKGRASAAAKKRREDPNPERRGPARNVATKVKEALGLYGPFTVTINTGERPQSRTKTKKFKREDDAILWAEDWLEDFPQYSFATAQVTDPDGNVVWATDESLEEQGMAEATGDKKFDTMMGRIVDPVAALKQDRVYEEQLEDYVFEFMNEFLTRMDRLGIEVWRNNPRAGEDLTNPKFEQAYEQASLKAVQKFMQLKKLDTNNQRLVAQVKADFDENADQTPEVAGFLGAFMQGFTTLRPGEIDILSKADMFKKPGQQDLDEKQDACYRKVKSRYKVWPSAYASGALVQCRKKGAANWGNKKKKE